MKKNNQGKASDEHSEPSFVKTETGAVEKVLLASAPNQHDPFAPDWIYKNIQEVTVNCRKLFFIYLALLSYAMLSAVTTPIENLFLDQTITMPIVKTSMPLYHYIIFTPLICIGFFIFNQLYLQKVNRLINYALSQCRGFYPDCDHKRPNNETCSLNCICAHQQNRLYPWIFIFGCYTEEKEKIISRIQRLFIFCSLWVFLPCTLIAFTFFVIKKHDNLLFTLVITMTAVGISVVFFFWNLQKNREHPLASLLNQKKNWMVWLLIFLLLGFFFFLHIKGREGRMWEGQESLWSKDATLLTKFFRGRMYADLRDKQLIPETSSNRRHSLILKNVHLEGANLSFANLEKANLRGSNIQNGSLVDTKLIGADFDYARLRGANLSGANLRNAKLRMSDLGNCDLSMADLEGADFSSADLQRTDLTQTKLKGTVFNLANIRFADFRGAFDFPVDEIKNNPIWQLSYFDRESLEILKLPERHNDNIDQLDFAEYDFSGTDFRVFDVVSSNSEKRIFEGADLHKASFQRTDFEGAILQKANLTGAILNGANLTKADLTGAKLCNAELFDTILDGANLQWADFRGAKGLSVDAILKAKFYFLAYFDENISNELGLARDHNIRLSSRILSAWNFQSQFRHLKGADFTNMNLSWAKFRSTDLENVNFYGALLFNADFTGSNLQNAKFFKANLKSCVLEDADVLWADFSSAKNLTVDQITGANNYQLAKYTDELRKTIKLPEEHNERLDKKNLYKYDLQEVRLMNADLIRIDFRMANLQGANLYGADLTEAKLKNAALNGTILSSATLEKASLRGANLEKAVLIDADLQFADLRKVKGLNREQLSDAKNIKLAAFSDQWLNSLGLPSDHNTRLKKKDFKYYLFYESCLKNADLKSADLEAAVLAGAQLDEADLSDAILVDAIMKNASLCKTNIEGADLQGADLRGIKACEGASPSIDQFAAVKTLFQAVLDEPLSEQLKDAYPDLFKKPKRPTFPILVYASTAPM